MLLHGFTQVRMTALSPFAQDAANWGFGLGWPLLQINTVQLLVAQTPCVLSVLADHHLAEVLIDEVLQAVAWALAEAWVEACPAVRYLAHLLHDHRVDDPIVLKGAKDRQKQRGVGAAGHRQVKHDVLTNNPAVGGEQLVQPLKGCRLLQQGGDVLGPTDGGHDQGRRDHTGRDGPRLAVVGSPFMGCHNTAQVDHVGAAKGAFHR